MVFSSEGDNSSWAQSRCSLIAGVAVFIPDDMVETAIQIARAKGDPLGQAEVVASLAHRVPIEWRSEIVASAMATVNSSALGGWYTSDHRAVAMSWLARYCQQTIFAAHSSQKHSI
jgi:hypothetical protein